MVLVKPCTCALRLPPGVMCVYLIIIADMLVGSAPEYGGVLPTMLGRHDGPWFLSRPLVVSCLPLRRAARLLAWPGLRTLL